ncbi:hypothetical protein HMPREF9623_00774 [Stomatobaculum longum]|uniref:Glycosyltransferase 2-like domain-containing protein n=1 Tax=Stomatobaculum longum TaxID=796942 RepID=A0AA37DGI9_9FIRM|nr:glycosyltransferase family 2 protein [Stomatobaculum longum]EHO17175.1 hypothetical protein HMPREF9623_00774 [Stomatobaculum longum]
MRAEQWEREDARVTVVIPNYNGMKYLPQCIAALRRQTERDFSLLVMENGSTDGSAEWLREEGIPTIFSEKNLGFAGGVNRAVREVRTPYVLLLNNDTEVFPDFVRALEASISRNERIFSVSAMMIRTQNHDEIDDAGDLVSLPGWAFQRGTMEPCAAYEKEAEVFSACGGAAIYRTDLYRALGGLDESYFAYLEDIDLGWRAKLAGYRNLYCPAAKVYHFGSATSGSKYNAFKVRLSARNHIFTMAKNQPLWQLIWNLPFLLGGIAVKAAFFAKKGLLSDYLRGLTEGLTALPAREKTDFSKIPTSRMLAIEWELVLGTAAYVRHYVSRGAKKEAGKSASNPV